jgi:hypothetical protein
VIILLLTPNTSSPPSPPIADNLLSEQYKYFKGTASETKVDA